MDWRNFWNLQADKGTALQQVARNGHNNEKMSRLMNEQAAFVAQQTGLQFSDQLLDVCCGNGIFTKELSHYSSSVTGIDFSEKLITEAKRNYSTINFSVADAIQLSSWSEFLRFQSHFDVITLCFSFQYFETIDKGTMVLEGLKHLLKPGGKIMLTDVPDRTRFFNHYNTISRIAGLAVQMAKGKNVMGKFWSEEELSFICRQLGLTGEKINQPGHFPYAHYRMDYLITKP